MHVELTREAVNSTSDRALVGKESRDPSFMLGPGSTDKSADRIQIISPGARSCLYGVFPLVFRALKRAFSAPRICTVEAGYFARFVNEPLFLELEI
jgi:hypothetical protein